jgi:hypothetical protein
MSKIRELLQQSSHEELWQMCCGFLDLSLEQFMAIQKQLLLEQIELLKRSELGRKVMHGAMPVSIEEFRAQVPLTVYKDYCPELLERRERGLPSKAVRWVQTSGRSGEYPYKWIPVSQRFWEEAGLNFCAIAILGACKERGEIAFKNGFKLLHAAAQSPYLTSAVAYRLEEDAGFKFLPPLHQSEEMPFEDRVEKGFRMALSEGMDGFFGLAGVLVAIGEKFKRGSGSIKLTQLLQQPKLLRRLIKALIKSKREKRAILPKDLWSLKVIVSMGTDSTVYQKRIRDLWGRNPLNVYGNSETIVVATQTWDYDGMVFFPNLNFLEFIPETEHLKWQSDHYYQPKTVLLNEVRAGENYELVITNLHGGGLVRYRVGDMIKITALRNEKLNIDIPQMAFERRADDLIDLGFIRLTEKIIGRALENTGIPYVGWTARKEIKNNKATLHVYAELENDYEISERALASAIYQQIKKVEDGLYVYKDIESLENLIDFKPVKVTILPCGVFSDYKLRKQSEGTSLALLKPPRINPSDKTLEQLLSTSPEPTISTQSRKKSAVAGG